MINLLHRSLARSFARSLATDHWRTRSQATLGLAVNTSKRLLMFPQESYLIWEIMVAFC